MENERCKDCEHCEYYINANCKRNNLSSFATLFLFLLICFFYCSAFYVLYQKEIKPKVYVNGRQVQIGEGSYADFLIDSGLCTADDIQKMIDELLEQ